MKITTLIFTTMIILALVAGGFFYYIALYVGKEKPREDSSSIDAKEKRIVAFGDSLTFGYNISQESSYPSQLQKKLLANNYSYTVINLGVNGDTTAMGLARIQSVMSYEPDIVLLELGANDYLQSLPPETARKNLEEIIKTLDDKKIQVILVNVSAHSLLPFPNKEIYNKIMPELATKYGLSLVSSFLEDVIGTDNLMLEDRIHPNIQGYTKALNQNLWPVLQKQLVK